ncbi:MAG: methylenetetrahydrofolate reductase [Actinomycetia bacterium]|nr:methylenetetrahydrofolate reductase [Actinomycetes bacterium]
MSAPAIAPAGAASVADLLRQGDAVRAVGVEMATELCQQLLDDGAPRLHLYTLNRSTASREIYADLDLSHRSYDLGLSPQAVPISSATIAADIPTKGRPPPG